MVTYWVIQVICKPDQSEDIDKIKVIDFGFSNYPQVLAKEKSPDIVGTPNYMAP
jgi:serine/threonine protein kinase